MNLLAIDPGLTHTGFCTFDGSDIRTSEVRLSDGVEGWRRMGDLVLAWIDRLERRPHAIGLEDYVFMSPKATHGLVKHSVQMGKLIGYLVALLEARGFTLVLVPASKAQRNQPKGKKAKAAGIPGRNDHERSAYFVGVWLKGSMRLAGGRV